MIVDHLPGIGHKLLTAHGLVIGLALLLGCLGHGPGNEHGNLVLDIGRGVFRVVGHSHLGHDTLHPAELLQHFR